MGLSDIWGAESGGGSDSHWGGGHGRDDHGVAPYAGGVMDDVAGSSGYPLPIDLRERFEASLGVDLGGVRLHDGDAAAAASEALGAHAYTVGQDIHFAGHASPSDERLLAHEVAHTAQQAQASSGAIMRKALDVSQSHDPCETEADRAAGDMLAGRRAQVTAASPVIARDADDDNVMVDPAIHGPAMRRDAPLHIESDESTPSGNSTTRTRRDEVQVRDSRAEAAELRGVLETRRRTFEDRNAALGRELTTTPTPAAQARLREQMATNQAEISRMHSHEAALLAVNNDQAGQNAVADLAREHGVHPAERTTRSGRVETDVTERGILPDHAHTLVETGADGSRRTQTDSRRTTLDTSGVHITSADGDQRTDALGGGRNDQHQTVTNLGAMNGGGGLGRTRTDDNTRTAVDGSAVQHRDVRSRSLSANGQGAGYHFNDANTRTETNAAGQTTRSDATHTGGDLGVVYGRDGHGVRAAVNGGRETRTEQGGSSLNGSADAQITDHGAAAHAAADGSLSTGPVRTTGSFGAGGSFTVNVNPVANTHPPEYEVVMEASFNASVGGGVGNDSTRLEHPPEDQVHSRGATVTAGVELRGSRSLTFTHRMSHDEAARYLASLRTVSAGADAHGHPEFDLMARARTLATEGRARAGAAAAQGPNFAETEVLSNPSLASQLSPGSSMELSTTIGATARLGANAHLGAVEAGASGSASRDQTRRVRVASVTVNGHNYVEITLTFSDARSQSLSGNASVDGIGGHVSDTHDATDGRSVVVRLDPASSNTSYAADFQTVMAAEDQAGAERVAEHFHAQITRSQEEGNVIDGAVGVAGTELGESQERRSGQTVTVGAADADGTQSLSGDTTGRATDRLTGRVLGHDVVSVSDSNSATNHVGAYGDQQVDINHDERAGLPVVPAALADELHLDSERLESVRLSGGDVDTLTARAADSQGWSSALSGAATLHIHGPWMSLRAELVSPHPDAAWVAADPGRAIANRLARGRALTRFIGGADPTYSHGAILAALRGGGNELAGEHLEWPDGIHDRAAELTAIRARLDGLADAWAGHTDAPGIERIHAEAAQLRGQLRDILNVVQLCHTYQDLGAQTETIQAVQRELHRIDHLEQDVLLPGGEPTPAAADGGEAHPPGQDPAAAPADNRALHDELSDIIVAVQSAKESEQQHLESANASRWRYSSHWYAGTGNLDEALDALDAIDQLFPRWAALLHRGQAVATQLGGDPGALDHFRPNTNWRVQIMREVVGLLPDDRRGFASATREPRWRAQWNG